MRGDIPLIKTHYPLIVMKRPNLKDSIIIRKEIGNHSSMAFVLVGMKIKINRSTPIKTTCGGLLCDKQRCSDWNGTRGCGCYHFRDDISNIAFEHSVFFRLEMISFSIVIFLQMNFNYFILIKHYHTL